MSAEQAVADELIVLLVARTFQMVPEPDVSLMQKAVELPPGFTKNVRFVPEGDEG